MMKANILVVDDTRDNLRLLSNILTEQGYQVRPVSSGFKALSAAKAKPPDLILLDIMMPGLDGYAVCEQLKADERTYDIPVIFISALNETFDKVKAFNFGGVDYITKPFQSEEILSRVKTHLSLRQMQQQLLAQNAQLQQEIAERKRVEEALREANISKDTFFSIIAHDLKSPFTVLLGSAELALQYFDESNKKQLKEYITQIQSSAESVYVLLENLLTWSRLQRGVMEYTPENLSLHQITEHIIQIFTSTAEQKQVLLHNRIPETVGGYADTNMISTVIRNLLSNALKFTDAGGNIDISARQDDQEVEVTISDTGVGIPEKEIPNLLQIDVRTTTRGTAGERGTGLGLPLCKDLVEKNGGVLNVESEPGNGTTIRFTLPSSPLTQKFPSTSKIAGLDLEGLTRATNALPKAWQTELQYAVEALNIGTANTLIDQIRQQDAALADALGELVKDYRFDMLQALFQETKE